MNFFANAQARCMDSSPARETEANITNTGQRERQQVNDSISKRKTMSFVDAVKGFGLFLWTLFLPRSYVAVSDSGFVYATTNYSGIYSLVSLYDSYEMTTLDTITGYTLGLNPSLTEDDPNDDKDLYDMVLSNGVDDMIAAKMKVAKDMSEEDPGQRKTDEIVELFVVSTTLPATVRSENEWSVEEAIYYLVPYLTQIRFYDIAQTELIFGGPSGSIEMKRVLV